MTVFSIECFDVFTVLFIITPENNNFQDVILRDLHIYVQSLPQSITRLMTCSILYIVRSTVINDGRPDKEDGDVLLTSEAPVDMLLVLLWKP